MRLKSLLSVGLCAVSLCLSATAFAQDQAGETPRTATLRVNARLVVLDVVITDKKGQPIDDLKRDELRVTEDGKPQMLRSFEVPSSHQLPVATETPEQAAAEVFDPAQPANFGRSPANILVLDQLNTHFADSSFARRQLQDYLKKQPAVLAEPTTLVTIFPDHFKLLEQFTRDRDKLLQALDKAPVKYPWQLELNGKADYGPVQRLDTSLHALEEIAGAYARIPGRKNLIWIGGGFPSLDPGSLATNDQEEVDSQLKHVSNVLLDSRVVLYAVDPSSTAARMTEITDFQQMAFAQLSGELSSTNADPVDAGGDFDSLSTLTGGRVVRNLNNVTTQIAIAVDYASHFYTLSYAPTNNAETALKFRKIAVTCTRADCVVTTRTGYYAGQPPKENLKQNLAYDLSTAAEGAMPLTGLRVTVELNPSVGAVSNDAWMVHVAAPELSWKTQDDRTSQAEVAIMAVSLNSKGKMISHVLREASASAREGVDLHDASKMANFEFDAKPAPKATTLRFIVRDATTGRMGSFDVPVK